jgi:hypothetical protein
MNFSPFPSIPSGELWFRDILQRDDRFIARLSNQMAHGNCLEAQKSRSPPLLPCIDQAGVHWSWGQGFDPGKIQIL